MKFFYFYCYCYSWHFKCPYNFFLKDNLCIKNESNFRDTEAVITSKGFTSCNGELGFVRKSDFILSSFYLTIQQWCHFKITDILAVFWRIILWSYFLYKANGGIPPNVLMFAHDGTRHFKTIVLIWFLYSTIQSFLKF